MLRLRLKYGIKEELLDLVRLEQVGRVRARLMYNNGIKSVADLKKEGASRIVEKLFGKEIAEKIMSQVA
jgi:helicase